MFRFNIWFFGGPHSFRAPPKCYQASSDIFVQPPFLAFAKLLLQLMLNNMIHQTVIEKHHHYAKSIHTIIVLHYIHCLSSLHQNCGKLKCQHMSAIVYAPSTKPHLTWHCPSNHPNFTTGPLVQTPYVLPLWVWLVDDRPYHFHSLVSEVVDWTRCVAPCVLGLQGRTNLGFAACSMKQVTPIPQLAIGNPRFFCLTQPSCKLVGSNLRKCASIWQKKSWLKSRSHSTNTKCTVDVTTDSMVPWLN